MSENDNNGVSDKGIIKNIESSIEYIKLILTSIERLSREESALTIDSLDKLKKIVIGIKILYDELVTVPVSLSETYTIIKDIINHVHASRFQLKGAVDGLLKKTGEQLSKVTSATEVATNKILDVSDQLTEKQNNLIEKLDGIIADHPELTDKLEEVKNDIYSQQDDTFLILDYLQFQDITSQQLEAAFGMLNQIEDSLLLVAEHLEGLDGLQFIKSERRNTSYDANAEFVDRSGTQAEIDKLVGGSSTVEDVVEDLNEEDLTKTGIEEVEEVDENIIENNEQEEIVNEESAIENDSKDIKSSDKFSQADIDALINANKPKKTKKSDSEVGKVSQEDIDALMNANKPKKDKKSDSAGGKVSQADIDALINANKPKKTKKVESSAKVSQADIDALFKK